jgi:hypothetical protein
VSHGVAAELAASGAGQRLGRHIEVGRSPTSLVAGPLIGAPNEHDERRSRPQLEAGCLGAPKSARGAPFGLISDRPVRRAQAVPVRAAPRALHQQLVTVGPLRDVTSLMTAWPAIWRDSRHSIWPSIWTAVVERATCDPTCCRNELVNDRAARCVATRPRWGLPGRHTNAY